MCGIAGLAYQRANPHTVDDALLRRMHGTLRHRGPDSDGTYVNPGRKTGLGFQRLAIIDLAGGCQPLSNEDGTVWIVFNGEIYNYQDLRKNLVTKGHVFKTDTDTEAIVHLYEEEGTACVHHLRGMFAFAIWDERNGELFMARDRLGKKPLNYYTDERGIFFGSEIKAILEVADVPREVDPLALDHFLSYQYVPAPLTMFKGISKLPPGHFMIWRDGQVFSYRYWYPGPARVSFPTFQDWCDEAFSRTFEAVKLRLVSDVPLGAFLSGGIDSSIVTGLMSLAMKEPVKTFSIGFEEKEFNELDHARLVARHFKTDHHEFVVKPDAVSILPTLVRHYNEPFADSSAIPTYYLSKMTREHVTVALSGDAGDECFGGYTRYLAAKLARWADWFPPFLRRGLAAAARASLMPVLSREARGRKRFRFLKHLHRPAAERYFEWISVFETDEKETLVTGGGPGAMLLPEADGQGGGGGGGGGGGTGTRAPAPFYLSGDAPQLMVEAFKGSPRPDLVSRTAFADLLTYLPYDLLVKMDVATMANSLEARCPFLDHHLVEFALAVPPEYKISGWTTKFILRKAFASLLPPAILTRRKQGFGVPLGAWFRGELKEMLRDNLLDARARSRGYFRPEAVSALIDRHLAGHGDESHKLWALLVFELWHRMFIDAPPGSAA
ncbi:MAG: asparagine synthase (glutamine-hydrolyzing) [Planctomycetes bacterium]|nr:asparagine synthase (glutamine-hydrolyzing) [Planctomycetota bacterium]